MFVYIPPCHRHIFPSSSVTSISAPLLYTYSTGMYCVMRLSTEKSPHFSLVAHSGEASKASPLSLASMTFFNSSMGTRICARVSLSRMVTCLSSKDSKSMVTQNGVPISSWRLYLRPML